MTYEHLQPAEYARLRQAKSAARFVGLVIPLGLTLLGLVLNLIWLPRLPNPMAVHWDGAGVADGFDSPILSLVMFPIVNLLITSLFFFGALQHVAWLHKRDAPVWGSTNRLLPAIVLGTVTLMLTAQLGTTIPQLDLADARDMPQTFFVMIAAFGVGILVTFLAFIAQPRLRIDPQPLGGSAEPIELQDSEPAEWFGVVSPTKTYLWVVGSTVLLLVGTVVLIASQRPVAWIPLILVGVVTVFVVLASVASSQFYVQIDEHGFEARAIFGWPAYRVAAANVASVDAQHISPFAEFGGWGLRSRLDGATGIVMRAGEGIRIKKHKGRELYVTIDDAQTAATVLRAVATRAAEAPSADAPDTTQNAQTLSTQAQNAQAQNAQTQKDVQE